MSFHSDLTLTVFALSLSTSVCAEAEDSDSIDESVFQPAGSQTVAQDGFFDEESTGFTGNPMGSWLSWWPEDLVVAPIPSRSPEFGWGLTLAAGYFLDPDKANPDIPKATVGIAVKGTENKSYASGGDTPFFL